jgi:hypothetical protein
MTENFKRYKVLKQRFSQLIKSPSQHRDWIIEARNNLEILKEKLGIH